MAHRIDLGTDPFSDLTAGQRQSLRGIVDGIASMEVKERLSASEFFGATSKALANTGRETPHPLRGVLVRLQELLHQAD